jgi:hypothetical protein
MPFALQFFWYWGSKDLHHGSKNKHKAFLAFLTCQGMQDFNGDGCQFFSFFFQTYWSLLGMFLYHETCKKAIIERITHEWNFCGRGCKHWNNWTILGVGTQAKKGWAIGVVFMPIIWTKGKWEMVHSQNGTQGIPH